jgi:hypothetical protein
MFWLVVFLDFFFPYGECRLFEPLVGGGYCYRNSWTLAILLINVLVFRSSYSSSTLPNQKLLGWAPLSFRGSNRSFHSVIWYSLYSDTKRGGENSKPHGRPSRLVIIMCPVQTTFHGTEDRSSPKRSTAVRHKVYHILPILVVHDTRSHSLKVSGKLGYGRLDAKTGLSSELCFWTGHTYHGSRFTVVVIHMDNNPQVSKTVLRIGVALCVCARVIWCCHHRGPHRRRQMGRWRMELFVWQ